MKYAYEIKDNRISDIHSFEDEATIPSGLVEFNEVQLDSILQQIQDGLKPIEDLNKEKDEIEKWLLDNDYKFNKFVLGDYDDRMNEWESFKIERSSKINRLNAIYNELS